MKETYENSIFGCRVCGAHLEIMFCDISGNGPGDIANLYCPNGCKEDNESVLFDDFFYIRKERSPSWRDQLNVHSA